MINIISYDKSKNHFLSRQNAVRHTLSLRKRFVRVPDPKRPYKSMWTISDDYQRNHLKDKQRHLKMKRRSENAQGSSQTMDLDYTMLFRSVDEHNSIPKSTRRHIKLDKFIFGTPWLPDLLCTHWFASSVWNFCRWVADFPPRETSPATKSEEKRMFSRAMLRADFVVQQPWWSWQW